MGQQPSRIRRNNGSSTSQIQTWSTALTSKHRPWSIIPTKSRIPPIMIVITIFLIADPGLWRQDHHPNTATTAHPLLLVVVLVSNLHPPRIDLRSQLQAAKMVEEQKKDPRDGCDCCKTHCIRFWSNTSSCSWWMIAPVCWVSSG